MNIFQYIYNLIKQWFPNANSHITVPPVLVASTDWEVPTTDNVSQNWLKYLSLPYRTQWVQTWDEDNCATRAAIEVLEALLNYYLMNNLFPQNLADFLKKEYCNDKGYVKLSIRYNARLNNTTTQGVSVDTVWDNFAIFGIVPESLYPDPPSPFTWEQYYQAVPQNIIDYGEKSLTLFKILWQVVANDIWTPPNQDLMKKTLNTCPLYFASGIGSLNASGVEVWNGKKEYIHARVIYAEDSFQECLDSYSPEYLKRLDTSFPLACVVQASIKII